MSSTKEGTGITTVQPEAALLETSSTHSTEKVAKKKGAPHSTKRASSTTDNATTQHHTVIIRQGGSFVSWEDHAAALEDERRKYKVMRNELLRHITRLEKALERKTVELKESKKQLTENRKRLRDETTAAAVKKRAKRIDRNNDDDDEDNNNNAPRRNKHEIKWHARLEELKRFKQKFGHCNVSRVLHAPDHKQLALWVSVQRHDHKKMCHGKSTNMTASRARKLSELGFQWKIAKTDVLDWETRFRQLKQFKEEHGHLLVPQKLENPPGLGNWVLEQRKAYRYGQMESPPSTANVKPLTQERIEKMEAIGFRWCLRNRTCQKKSDLIIERQEIVMQQETGHGGFPTDLQETEHQEVIPHQAIADHAMAHPPVTHQETVPFY